MPNPLNGRKVAFLATDGVEQVELTAPWNALKQAGAAVKLVSDKLGEIQAMNHDQKGDRFPVDAEVSKVSARDFDALVLPGGVVKRNRRAGSSSIIWVGDSSPLCRAWASRQLEIGSAADSLHTLGRLV